MLTTRTPPKSEAPQSSTPSSEDYVTPVDLNPAETLNKTITKTPEIKLNPEKPSINIASTLNKTITKTITKTPELILIPEKPIPFESKTAEAKACLMKAKLSLGRSGNIARTIKSEVTQAVERLYQLVKEADQKSGKKEKRDEKKVEENEKTKGEEIKEKGEINEIIARMEEQTRLLKENGRKMDEIKQIIELKKDTLATASYAAVVANDHRRETVPERQILHSVVIASKKEEDTGEEVLEKIRKVIDAKEGWVKVEKVRKGRDRKVIIGCETKEERRKIKERLEVEGGGLVVEEVKNKDPLLMLRDVLLVHSDEDILKAIRNQNSHIFHDLDNEDDRLEIKYRRRARNPHNGHIVLTVSPTIWRRATDSRKMRIDLQRVNVEDQSPLVQCTRCLGYGHSRRFCKEESDSCSHCGGPHLKAECPSYKQGNSPTCLNCTRVKNENCGHNAFSSECPVRKKWDAIARESVAYC